MTSVSDKVLELMDRGATVQAPTSIHIGTEVDVNRIAEDVILHAGCRITGEETSIGPGCVLGEEAPVTLDDCQLGANVDLKGGYFSGATLLTGVTCGSCAHVRPGSLLEEYSSIAHSVGIKQTLLMPWVTLGSLINFCDCLMAGGTSRKNHSEVGSSYVHFNFTPHQDKATPSLIGDVPRGVLLNQPPIFLGGQGGLVGPIRIEYGTVIAAGTIARRDITELNRLVFGDTGRPIKSHPHTAGRYGDVTRIVAANLAYIGNLHALYQWYGHVRSLFMAGTPHDAACHRGALNRIQSVIRERVMRLTELAEKMPASITLCAGTPAAESQQRFMTRWPDIAPGLERDLHEGSAIASRAVLLTALHPAAAAHADTLTAVQGLPPNARHAATDWLQSIVDSVTALW